MSRELREAIQHITGTRLTDQVSVFSAIVKSVDEATRTCVVETMGNRQNTTLENVKLMASVDDGIFYVPEIETTVFITYSKFNFPYVALFSALSKIVFATGENSASLELSEGKIKFNDGSFDGLVKVKALTTKLNNIENKLNDLISAYNTHTHAGVTTGAGTSGITPATVSGSLTPTQQGDIENNLITHGS